MDTETTSHNSEMEFDVNNQLGDPDTMAQIETENQDSGTRGQDNEEAETQQITPELTREGTEKQQIQISTDMATMLQQIMKQMKEFTKQLHEQTVQQLREQMTETKKRIAETNDGKYKTNNEEHKRNTRTIETARTNITTNTRASE